MLTNLGKVSAKTQGCNQFVIEPDSKLNKFKTYTDGLGHFAGTRIAPNYFLVPACA